MRVHAHCAAQCTAFSFDIFVTPLLAMPLAASTSYNADAQAAVELMHVADMTFPADALSTMRCIRSHEKQSDDIFAEKRRH